MTDCLHENYVVRERAGAEYHFCSTSATCLAWRHKHADIGNHSPPGPWLFTERPRKAAPKKAAPKPKAEPAPLDSSAICPAEAFSFIEIYQRMDDTERTMARAALDAIDGAGGK